MVARGGACNLVGLAFAAVAIRPVIATMRITDARGWADRPKRDESLDDGSWMAGRAESPHITPLQPHATAMSALPPISTPRLVLRGLAPTDAPRMQHFLSDWEVVRTTGTIPHPYPEGAAEAFVADQPRRIREGEAHVFAITQADDGALMGCAELRLTPEHRRADLGYWIAPAYWGRGFATEAADAIVRYGFETLELHRVAADHFSHNPASGVVLERIGMRHEGHLRKHVLRWGKMEDIEKWGMLHTELRPRHA